MLSCNNMFIVQCVHYTTLPHILMKKHVWSKLIFLTPLAKTMIG